MPLLFQPSPPPCIKCGTTTVVAPAFEDGQRVFVVRCPACGRACTYSIIAYASGELDHGAASVGGLVVWGRPRQLARSAVETSARPRDGSSALLRRDGQSGSIELKPLPTICRRTMASRATPRRRSAFNFRPAIVLYVRDPTSSHTGKRRLARELPQQSGDVPKSPLLTEAVLVPSAAQ
jgi:hypothetical protein